MPLYKIEILIDYDGAAPPDWDWRARHVINFIWGYDFRPVKNINLKLKTSPSGKGYHLTCSFTSHFRPFSRDIVLAQSLIGSDWKRELLNYGRIRAGVSNWNILFSTKLRKLDEKQE